MIIIEKRKLIGILLLSFLTILATSIWAYRLGMQFQLKAHSERLLFFGFIAAGVQLALSYALLHSGKKTANDFSMLMDSIRRTGIVSENRAGRLHNLGFELQSALESAHKITEQKTKKIASLHGLLSVITGMIDHPLIIAGLNGEIIEASPKAQTEFECKQGMMLSYVFPHTDIREAFKEASVTHLPVQQKNNTLFIPVFSTADEISYFLVDISSQDLLGKFTAAMKNIVQEDPSKRGQSPKGGVQPKQHPFAAFDKLKQHLFKSLKKPPR
ncbi:MAG: hypothetical protein ACTTH7_05110 [Treponema sp.]